MTRRRIPVSHWAEDVGAGVEGSGRGVALLRLLLIPLETCTFGHSARILRRKLQVSAL